MSELKAYCPHANRDGFYHKFEADKVIAEKDKEIEELKQKLEDVNELIKAARQMLEDAKATHYAVCVDAGMRERRLHRALYKACANWAKSERYTEATWHGDEHREELWAEVQDRCLKKAEEFR